jgi:hypothetical protein
MNMTLELNNTADGFAHEMQLAWMMNWEGQRVYREAYKEANKDTGEYDEHAPWQYRMDLGERMQADGDKMTNDVEARAIAAGVDVTDMLNLVNDQLKIKPKAQKRHITVKAA